MRVTCAVWKGQMFSPDPTMPASPSWRRAWCPGCRVRDWLGAVHPRTQTPQQANVGILAVGVVLVGIVLSAMAHRRTGGS